MHELGMTLRTILPVGAAALLLAACGPDLGECDESALGGSSTGTLAPHAGQLIVQQKCASSRCHTVDAEGELRSGAPADLNFDVVPNTTSVEDRVKVLEGNERVQEYREAMWGEIEEGAMPPPPPAGGGELDADEKETVRNWLACNAPVIAAPPPNSGGTDWTSIYGDLIGTCAGCHDSAGAMVAGGGFELGERGDPCGAHDNLVSAPASGSGCNMSGMTLVVPGQPDQSLLVHKLSDNPPPCGSYMPLTDDRPLIGTNPELVNRLRAWITAGALAPECP